MIAEARIEILETEINRLRDNVSTLAKENERLQTRTLAAEKQATARNNSFEEANRFRAEMEERAETAEKRVAELEQRLASAASIMNQVHADSDEAIRTQAEGRLAAEKRVAELAAQIATLTIQLEGAQRLYKAELKLHATPKQMPAEIGILRSQLAEVAERAEAAEKRVAELEAKLAEATTSAERWQEEARRYAVDAGEWRTRAETAEDRETALRAERNGAMKQAAIVERLHANANRLRANADAVLAAAVERAEAAEKRVAELNIQLTNELEETLRRRNVKLTSAFERTERLEALLREALERVRRRSPEARWVEAVRAELGEATRSSSGETNS